VEQRYRPQIAYLQAYQFLVPPTTSREAEIELFSAPEILSADIETQHNVHHSLKSAEFQSFRDQSFFSVAHGYGTLPNGSKVTFLTYTGKTTAQNLPFQIRFDLERLTATEEPRD
jgi:hypothetical protein